MKKYLLLLSAVLGVCLPAFAAVLPVEKLLPDDTLAVITIPDFAKSSAVWSNAPMSRFWNDDAMKPFRDKFMSKVKSTLIDPMEHDLGIKFDDYTSLPQGQLSIAVVQDGWQGKDNEDPSLILILDTKSKSGQLKSKLAELQKKWVDSGKTVKREQVRDVEFSAITVSGDDLPKSMRGSRSGRGGASSPDDEDSSPSGSAAPPVKTTFYIGQSDSLLLVSTSTKVLNKVLSAMSGGSVTTLSEVPAFSANYNSSFRDALSYGWVNVRLFVGILKSSIPQPSSTDSSADSSSPDARKIISVLGFDGLRSAGFSSRITADGSGAEFFLSVPEDARSGIFKLVSGESKDCNPPPFVPADVTEFQRYRIDGQKVWDGIRGMVKDVNPAYLGMLDLMINSMEAQLKEKNPDFDLRKNVIGNLGNDIIGYRKAPKGNSLLELGSPPTIYLIGSPNPEQLAASLSTLLGMSSAAGAPKQRDFLGHKVYSISSGSSMAAASGTSQSLSFSSTTGYLALSQDTGILEEYLRNSQGSDKSLRDLPGLADATQKVMDRTSSMFGFANNRESFKATFTMLKKELGADDTLGTVQLLAATAGIKLPEIKEWVDVSLLPDFDRVSKYFGFSVVASGPTPEGIVIKSYTPTPPGLK